MQPERAEVPAMPWPTGPVARPEALTAPPSPIGLLNAFRRRWFLATVLGLALGAGLALIPFFMMPVNYDVASWLTVAEEEPHLVYKKRTGAEEFKRFKSAQAQMLTTPFVLTAALRRSEVNSLPMLPKGDQIEFLQSKISVNYPGDSTLMRISMKGKDDAQLKIIVDAVREAYLKEIVEKQFNMNLHGLAQLKDILTKLDQDISRKRSEIEVLVSALGTTPEVAARDVRLFENELGSLQSQLLEAKRTLRKLASEKMMAESALASVGEQDPTVGEHLVEDMLRRTDPEYLSIRDQWLQLTNLLRQEREKAKDETKSPNRRLEADLDDLDQEMILRRARAREELAQQIQTENIAAAEQALNEITASYSITEQNIQDLAAQLTEMSQKTVKATKNSNEILRKEEDLRKKLEVRAELAEQVEQRELESSSPPRVEAWQPATTEGNDRMMKYSIVGFSGLLGFLGAAFGVTFVEFQKRRISSPTEISEGLGVHVIGALPSLTGNTWSKMVSRNKGAIRGLLAESIDSLRTTLIHGESANKRKVIMVTSATAGEGKTTLATQLAASLARAGRRTLLVDADLRAPKAHRVFELPLDPGLSEVLRNEAEVDDVIRPTRAPGLWMMTAGGCCQECIQALSRDDIRVMFGKLRDEFDFVIVDSGPVLSAADSVSLSVCVDVAVLSVLKDTSQANKVYEAYERLDTVGVHVMGAVVNGVNNVVRRKAAALPARAST